MQAHLLANFLQMLEVVDSLVLALREQVQARCKPE